MGKLSVSLGNPFLILIYSLGLLLLGCAIGLYWKATPGTAFCVAALGAILMVIHDMAMGVMWFVLPQSSLPTPDSADRDDGPRSLSSTDESLQDRT